MDFAPYQSSPPEHGRTLSPSIDGATSPRASFDRRPSPNPQFQYGWQQRAAQASPPPLQHPQPQRGWSADGIRSPEGAAAGYQSPGGAAGEGGPRGVGVGDYFGGFGAREGMVNEFDTSLGLRLDYEACLAYLAFPPVGAILLLIAERKSDYVRFHAWQSALLFTIVFVVHLIFSWSTILSWLIFVADLLLIGWLTLRAYRDADTLDRFEVPFIGQIASRILDDE